VFCFKKSKIVNNLFSFELLVFGGEIKRGHALKQSLKRERKKKNSKKEKDYHSSF